MKIKITLVSALAWMVCAWIFPATVKAAARSSSSTTVQIGEIGDAAHVSLNVGDTLRVVLRATVSTGFGWHVATNNNDLLAFGGVTNMPAESKLAGAPGRQTITFRAAASGTGHLVLAYSRPWEKNVKPARTLTLDVDVSPKGASHDASLSVKPAGILMAKYMGKLPCADCSGILQSLAIYSPGPNNFINAYYVETMIYSGRPTVSVSAGELFLNKGTPANPNATVYSLILDSSNRTENYLVDRNVLLPLDDKMNLVHSPYNTSLRRIP